MTRMAQFQGPLAALFSRQQSGSAAIGSDYDVASVVLAPNQSLPLASAHDRSVWDATTGSADSVTIADVLSRAKEDLGRPWPQPLASAAARVHDDGDRVSWETEAFARLQRLSRASIAAAATLEKRWIDEVADGIWLLCEQSSWCWPAHDDTLRRHGAVLATVTDPFLDLGAGEVVAQLAWIDQLLGHQLDVRFPGLRSRIRHEARIRVLEPFLRRRDWHWIGLDGDVHNWNPWIHSNVLVAALRLLDQPGELEKRAEIIALVIEGIDRYVASLPEDGAIDEGYAYWWNGACRALEALELLRYATGGRLDAIPSVPALRNTVAFPHRMHLGGQWYLNLADGQAKPPADQPWHALHRAARRVGDHDALAHAAAHRIPGTPSATEAEGLGRVLLGMTDASWLAASPESSPLPRDVWLASIQVLVAREQAGSANGLTLAAKAGHNGEHHNHNDVGSFVVASAGIPAIVDAGRPTYTAVTFGPDRYSIWTMQSSWHGVPEIYGIAQGAGPTYRATEVEATISPSSAVLSLELAPAYPLPVLSTWRRTVRLERSTAIESRSRVVIDDVWCLDSTEASEARTTVRLLVAGQVQLGAGTALIIPIEGAPPLKVRWPAEVTATALIRRLDDPALSTVWGETLTRIDFDVTSRDNLSITVYMDSASSKDDR
ncbi:MAG: heparinase II/III family protein [Lacisediminihabitans sp.]